MGVAEQILTVLTSGGIVLALFIATESLLVERDQVYHRVLALVALCAGGYNTYFYVSKIGVLQYGGWYNHLFPALIFAIAPAIYVLFRLPLDSGTGRLSHYFIHFVPAVIFVVIAGLISKSSPLTGAGGPMTTVALFIAVIFLRSNPEVFSHFEDAIRQSAYKNSGLSSEDIVELKKKLHFLVESEKIYAGEKLTAGGLAKSLEIGSHHLSELLNLHMKTNFSTLINYYRVRDALELLTSEDVNTVNVAYRVGFNSKATFHRAFRKVMGCSPREFQSEPNEHKAVPLDWFS